ncbi:MAG: cell surface protein SprA [Bacteroidia bacterium]|nr:cell surface protein SprA [Bacteroidia bacterium]
MKKNLVILPVLLLVLGFFPAKSQTFLGEAKNWKLSSVPPAYLNASTGDPLSPGFKRAALSWYTINPNFYFGSSTAAFPVSDLSNHYFRQVSPNEFMDGNLGWMGDNWIHTLDLNYLPDRRGPYNFETDPARVNSLNSFKNPTENWSAIMRNLGLDYFSWNFDTLEFWLLDPFIYDPTNSGQLTIQFGNLSEDVLYDMRMANEASLTILPQDTTVWGLVPQSNQIQLGLSKNAQIAVQQDLGYDEMSDEDEAIFYQDFLDSLQSILGPTYLAMQTADPCGDNFMDFLGADYDLASASISDRYLHYNGVEGNNYYEHFPGVQPTVFEIPDREDLNANGELEIQEAFYEYYIPLAKGSSMQAGVNHIVEVKTANVTLPDGNTESVNWFHYKIPLTAWDSTYGTPPALKNASSIRLQLDGFAREVVLRLYEVSHPGSVNCDSNLVDVYPNPFTDQVSFRLRFPWGISYPVEIYDLAGRKVWEGSLLGQEKFTLNTTQLSPGVYIYSIFHPGPFYSESRCGNHPQTKGERIFGRIVKVE